MKEDNSTIHIAFCTDSNYAMPTGIAMISICENNKDENIHFHIVVTEENNIKEDQCSRFAQLESIVKSYSQKCDIYIIQESDLQEYVCSGASYISTTAFARIFLPSIISNTISKILYLDGDLIVDGSIRELWDISLDNYPLGAVVDTIGNSVEIRSRVKTPISVPYCNSGVLLINLDYWRKENISNKIIDCANKYKFPFLDQDSIHFVLGDKTKLLPFKYNVQTNLWFEGKSHWMFDYKYVEEVENAMESPIIVHYISSSKPWKDQYCPLTEIWEKYKKMSYWRNENKSHISVRLERTFLYRDLIDTYWQDTKLFENHLPMFLRLFRTSVKFKNKGVILSIPMKAISIYTSLLNMIYELKRKI